MSLEQENDHSGTALLVCAEAAAVGKEAARQQQEEATVCPRFHLKRDGGFAVKGYM
jgi:hypothetical protein